MFVDWSHGNSGRNFSLDRASGYWIGNVTLEHDLGPLSYSIYVNDTSNNYNISGLQQVNIVDNDPPECNDQSPDGGTTGDAYTYRITASDNIAMGNVFVNWKHGNFDQNLSLSKATGYWIGNVTLDHSIDDLTYVSYAKDDVGNFNISDSQTVRISDNDRPAFTDQSPGEGTTGDALLFRVGAADNIGIGSVHVDWSHGNLGENTTLSKVGNNWEGTAILDDSLESLTYIISVADTSGNFNNSENTEITLSDNDLPEITDDSPNEGTTGDQFTFDIAAADNIGVADVYVVWSHGSRGGNLTLSDVAGHWSGTATLDDSVDDLVYNVHVVDTSDNHMAGNERRADVLDNDAPSYTDLSPAAGSTGDIYTFNVSAADNIGVESVRVEWVHGGLGDNVSLELSGGFWVRSVSLDDDIGDLTYGISVKDTSDNYGPGSPETITVTDDDLPTYADRSDDSGTTGDEFGFMVEAWDNIDVEAVYVDWKHGILGNNMTLTLDEDYWLGNAMLDHDASNLSFTVSIEDTSGNYRSGEKREIPVIDDDLPTADAGPDKEVPFGTVVRFDGSGSTDNIGVSNYTWSFKYNGSSVFLYDSTPEFSFDIAGEYAVELLVRDVAGNERSDVINVSVAPADDTGDDDDADDEDSDDDADDDSGADDDDSSGDDDSAGDDEVSGADDDDAGGSDGSGGAGMGEFFSSPGGMAVIGVLVFLLVVIIVLLVIIMSRGKKEKQKERREERENEMEKEMGETKEGAPVSSEAGPVPSPPVEIREESLEGVPNVGETGEPPQPQEDAKARAMELYDAINAEFREGMTLGMDIKLFQAEYETALAHLNSQDYPNAELLFTAVRDKLEREIASLRQPRLEGGSEQKALPTGDSGGMDNNFWGPPQS